jgi:hypothetical protein
MMPFAWSSDIPPFCLQDNGYKIIPGLIEGIFEQYNNLLGFDAFWFDDRTNNDSCNYMRFGPTATGATGVTTYKIEDGQVLSADVTIDTRITQSCGLFHNVLLHELAHVLGMQHNKFAGSIMNFAVALYPNMSIIQQVEYASLSGEDIAYLQFLYDSQRFQYIFTHPSVQPFSHISGKSSYRLYSSIPMPTSKSNRKHDYWHFNEWALERKKRKKRTIF